MQLKRRRLPRGEAAQIGASLAAATCALLGTSAPGIVVAQEIGEWKVDTAALYYGEGDNRVQDLSFSVLVKTQPIEDNFLALTGTVDTLSGASPNGAAPSTSDQMFAHPITLTRSSGGAISQSGGSFTVPAGELPVDASFQDQRFAGSVDWQRPFGRLTLVDVGASLSTETDYKHVGLNTGVARDFNARNTTLSAALAWASDKVEPVGGSPVPFSPMRAATLPGVGGEDDIVAGEDNGFDTASQSKNVFDTLIGLTQVINRHTIVQLNYSLSRADGYLTDPYKLLSVVDPVTGDLVAGPDPGFGLYLYENRPDTREKRSLYGLLKRDFNGDVLDASYRVMTDDWGVHSQTFDFHYRWALGSAGFMQPHLRFYSQTAADFYHTVLFDGTPPAYATADYRLAEFDAVTLGLEYGKKTRSGELSARVEFYRQTSTPSEESLVGSLQSLDLTPDLKAVIAQFSYKLDW